MAVVGVGSQLIAPPVEREGPGALLHVAQHATLSPEMLQPADIYVLAGLVAHGDEEDWTLRGLAGKLLIDHTLIHRGLKRAEEVDLYLPSVRRVNLPNLEELLVHAGRFVAPARLGPIVPGVRAAWAAEPMSRLVRESPGDPPPVWPHAQGSVRGQALEPLHPAAVGAAAEHPDLGELLSVIDSLRAGDLRVRRVAAGILHDTMRRRTAPQGAAA